MSTEAPVEVSIRASPVARGTSPAVTSDDATRPIVVTRVNSSEWDAAARGFLDVVPEQTAVFCKAHWGQHNVESLLFKDGGMIIGGAAVVVRNIRPARTGIAIVKWGPAWRREGQQLSHAKLRLILESLKDEYCGRRNLHLTVVPCAHPATAALVDETLVAMGFHQGDRLSAPERYFVNVALGGDELLASLDQKWRYNLKKACLNTLEIAFAAGEDGLRSFLDLYRRMLDRKRFADHSAINALPAMMQHPDAAFRPRIALVHYEGRPTAGGVYWIHGDTASYMFGATDDRALGLKAGYALHWWFAEQLCQMDAITWYDLGGDDRDQGLRQFKTGFVGKRGQIVLSPPSRHYAPSIEARLVGMSAFAMRNIGRAGSRAMHRIGAIRP